MNAKGPKLCPKCHLLSLFAAQHCDCGYRFSSSVLSKTHRSGKQTAFAQDRAERRTDVRAVTVCLIKGFAWGASAALLTTTLHLFRGAEGRDNWDIALLLPLIFGALLALLFA